MLTKFIVLLTNLSASHLLPRIVTLVASLAFFNCRYIAGYNILDSIKMHILTIWYYMFCRKSSCDKNKKFEHDIMMTVNG